MRFSHLAITMCGISLLAGCAGPQPRPGAPAASARLTPPAIAATPVTLEVPAGQPLVLELQLDGYRPYLDERVEVAAGQTLRIRAAMVVAATAPASTPPPTMDTASGATDLTVLLERPA